MHHVWFPGVRESEKEEKACLNIMPPSVSQIIKLVKVTWFRSCDLDLVEKTCHKVLPFLFAEK
jgi:hypothetical protein